MCAVTGSIGFFSAELRVAPLTFADPTRSKEAERKAKEPLQGDDHIEYISTEEQLKSSLA